MYIYNYKSARKINSYQLAATKIMSPSMSRTPEMTDSCNQTAIKLTGTIVPASCSLKRKRPPKIEIPSVLREIVTTDTTTKLTSRDCQIKADAGAGVECFSGFGVGVASVKGKKSFMEDTHKIVSSSHGNRGFFGVYDGHGGSKAAEFVAENLHLNIFEMVENCSGNTAAAEAIKAGFLKTDEEFLNQGLGSGACCVTALIEGSEIFISNVGDCRAVLCKGGKAEAITKDHRAADENEKKRIEDKGGFVENHRGAWRVHGILAVSRSIGDAHLKDWVPAEPDTKIVRLTTDMEYLVLASDGLWEEVSNQEAIDIVMRSCSFEKRSSQRVEDIAKVNDEVLGCVTSPSPKLRRISLIKSRKQRGQSQSPCYQKTVAKMKEIENDFWSENESPPAKARRISVVNQTKMRTENQDQENNSSCKKTPYSEQLMAACRELVNLAVMKGSLDDITVMIIDLKHFKD